MRPEPSVGWPLDHVARFLAGTAPDHDDGVVGAPRPLNQGRVLFTEGLMPQPPAASDQGSDGSGEPDLLYFNGIDPETGTYAVPPMSIDVLAERVRISPGIEPLPRKQG